MMHDDDDEERTSDGGNEHDQNFKSSHLSRSRLAALREKTGGLKEVKERPQKRKKECVTRRRRGATSHI